MLNYQNKTKKELIDELIALKSKYSEINSNEHSIIEPEKNLKILQKPFLLQLLYTHPKTIPFYLQTKKQRN